MSALRDLQSARSRRDLATLLGFQLKALTYLVFQLPDAAKYFDFQIPKRSGGMRSISAPEPRLKVLQQRLADLLYACLDELEAPPRRRTLSHGFVNERSILTNAHAHRGRRHILNIDLLDFFPTINFGRVRGVLMKDRRFLLHERVATLIAQIACHNGALPQGSPCSPVLSNVVGHLLDIRMARLSRHHGCRYTRYADDLTFSTNEKEFPAGMAEAVGAAGDVWQAGPDLVDAIVRAGYAINPSKTRLQSSQSRQTVTGLVVNQQVNVRSEYYRTVRSMCSELFNTGSYYRVLPAHFAGGTLGDPDYKEMHAGRAGLAPLQGMLEHIYQVRNRYDERDSKEKKTSPTATRKLYHKFLFYRSFVALEKPLIIPEGKTDTIYLKAALERLPAFHPRLGEVSSGTFRHALDFQRFSSKIHDILQLGGGTGDFLFFMKSYRSNLDRYRFRAMRQPVILLIDNDSGADAVFKEALKLGVPAIAMKTTAPFYRLVDNLYLVKTPERGISGKTCIEDFFDPALLKTKVNGLDFDPAKKHNAVGKYGKQIFAESVIKPNAATIDFSGFEPLFERVVAVLDDYAASPCPAP